MIVLPSFFSSQVEVTTFIPDKTRKVAVFLGLFLTFIDKISPLSPIKGETEDIPPHNSITLSLFHSSVLAKIGNEGKMTKNKIKKIFHIFIILFVLNTLPAMYSITRNIAFIIGLVVLVSSCSTEPKPNPNLEGSVQDFDVCVRKQKAKGLSTDKCWDML